MKKILITGGQMHNKGAQAMTFTVVCEMKRLYPNCEIVLLPVVFDESNTQYSFSIVPFSGNYRLPMLGNVFRFFSWLFNAARYKATYKRFALKLKQCFLDAECLIDISGYALSSHMGFRKSCLYLLTIVLAKKYKIPMYILPQSFGPFNYPKPYQRFFVRFLMRKYMNIPREVYAREQAGLKRMMPFCRNIFSSPDIVLQGGLIDPNLIYKPDMLPSVSLPEITSHAVGIIPNRMTWQHGDAQQVLSVFIAVIQNLLENKYNVYLLAHSKEDLALCEQFKTFFADNEKVRLISQEYDCVLLQRILAKFDFIIASRYHSIVHAYKENVPVIAIGWAEKYAELLQTFGQSQYLFDVRERYDSAQIISAVVNMISHIDVNRSAIKTKLDVIKEDSIFNSIEWPVPGISSADK